MTCIHHCNTIQSVLTALKILCASHIYPSLLQPQATTVLFAVSIVLAFLECHIVGIIQCVAFSDRCLSHGNVHLLRHHVFSWLDISFFFLTLVNIPLSRCVTVHLFIHLLKDILIASKFWQL